MSSVNTGAREAEKENVALPIVRKRATITGQNAQSLRTIESSTNQYRQTATRSTGDGLHCHNRDAPIPKPDDEVRSLWLGRWWRKIRVVSSHRLPTPVPLDPHFGVPATVSPGMLALLYRPAP